MARTPARAPAKAPAVAPPLPAALADELAAFIEYLRVERQLSPHTRNNYQAHLEAMTAELVALGLTDWGRLEASQVRTLVTRMHKGGLAPRSLSTKVSALRSFCDWQVRQGRLTANPARGIVTPKQGRPLPAPRLWMRLRPAQCWTTVSTTALARVGLLTRTLGSPAALSTR